MEKAFTAAEKDALEKEKNAKLMSERARLRSNKLMTKAMSQALFGEDDDTKSTNASTPTLEEEKRISIQRRQSLTADALAAKKEADRLKREAQKLEESTKATRKKLKDAEEKRKAAERQAAQLLQEKEEVS